MGAPKYVLLSYDRQADFGGEEGYEETWAWCEDAEDLFADPSPPLREVYDLLGCAPEGQLSEALTRTRAGGPVPLGSLTLEILDRTGTAVGEWHLEETRLLGDRPCARDLTLRDVTIEATAPDHNPYDHPRRPPLSPGYRLLGAHRTPHGTCRDLARVSEVADEPMEPPLRLLGCSPQGALRTALDAGRRTSAMPRSCASTSPVGPCRPRPRASCGRGSRRRAVPDWSTSPSTCGRSDRPSRPARYGNCGPRDAPRSPTSGPDATTEDGSSGFARHSTTTSKAATTGRPARPTTSTAATSPTCPASSARWARP